MAQRDNWNGAGHRQPDQNLLAANNSSRLGDRHMTVNDSQAGWKDERFFPYFGLSNKMIPPRNTYGQTDEENYDLPDAYKGSNSYMRSIIITQIQESETWGTSIALPWKKHEGSMEVAWDEWNFNDTLMTRTPEEAVSRVLSCHFADYKASIVRYGIALIMEHGFWKTEKGQQQYALQIVQIKNAIVLTAEYGVTLALLNPQRYVDDNEKYMIPASTRSKTQINNFFQDEIDEFAIFNKAEDGFQVELGRLDAKLKRRNQITGDLVIVPSGANNFVNNRPEHQWHFISGGIRKDKFDKGKLSTGDGRMVVESVMHKMGEHQPSQDPCYREVVIGSFFHMLAHHLAMVPHKKFHTSMLDQTLYSEDKDDWYRHSYALLVRCLGLYHGWETATKKGQMPLTSHLGRKVFENAATWGIVYQSAGRLDQLIKCINSLPDEVYADFVHKFMASDTVDPEPMQERKEEEAEAGNDVSTALLQMQLQDLAETQHGHGARLTVLYNWLLSLDEQAALVGESTTLRRLVVEYVAKHQAAVTNGLDAEAATMATYHLAWAHAQNLLVLYGLQMVIRELSPSASSLSPFEKYIAQSSRCKSCSGLSERDVTKLTQLHEESPYWCSSKGSMTEIELVAPEPGAGDLNSTFKKLQFPTHAFMLTSHYLVLLNVNQSCVQQLRDTDTPLQFNFNKHALNRSVMAERVGLLQFNIVMSALYAHLVHKAPKLPADYSEVAKDWIKMADPTHALTGNSLQPTIEAAKLLFTLDYQAPIDMLVIQLRDTLVQLYEGRLNDDLTVDKATEMVRAVDFYVSHVQSLNHIRLAGMKDVADVQGQAAGQALGINEPLLMALHSHQDYMDTFTHERRRARPTEEDKAKRKESLRVHTKHLTALLNKARKKGVLGDLKSADATPLWKATYVKLMEELPAQVFDTYYLYTNEHFINYSSSSAAKRDELISNAVDKISNDKMMALHAEIAGTIAPVSILQIRRALTDAHKLDTVKKVRIDPQTLAQEWTRLWSTKRNIMIANVAGIVEDVQRKRAALPPLQEFEYPQHVFEPLVTQSLLLARYNFVQLQASVLKEWPTSNEQRNSTFPALFLNVDGKAAADAKPEELVVDFPAGANEQSHRRVVSDVLSNFLLTELSVEDGYFWKWCIENNVIPAIGMLGFKPHIRYNAGTMIILSAWGQTGNTFYGHADMMLSDNAATKMHYGHFTYYSKSLVLQPRKIIHGRNCVVRDYFGGNGHAVWDATDPDDLEDYTSGELSKDIFVVPVLMNHKIDTNHMDITGQYHADVGAGSEANAATFYEASSVYRQYWGWRNDMFSLTDNNFSAVRRPRDNTIVFQEHQNMYNYATGKMDTVVLNKGHWGDRVYPGCGRVRRGLETYLKPVKYDGTNTIGLVI